MQVQGLSSRPPMWHLMRNHLNLLPPLQGEAVLGLQEQQQQQDKLLLSLQQLQLNGMGGPGALGAVGQPMLPQQRQAPAFSLWQANTPPVQPQSGWQAPQVRVPGGFVTTHSTEQDSPLAPAQVPEWLPSNRQTCLLLQHQLLAQQRQQQQQQLMQQAQGFRVAPQQQGYSLLRTPLPLNQVPIGMLDLAGDSAGASLPPAAKSGSGYMHNLSENQHAPARRAATDFNPNKAITKRLASAVHYQQVLDIITDSVHAFDEVNIATALHRLAKLQPPNVSHQSPSIIYTHQFQQLTCATRVLLSRFEAQAVSNSLWAFATLGYYPPGDLLDQIAEHATLIIGTFRPQATSNTLWAYAKLGYSPPQGLLTASAGQLVTDLGKLVPQDLSNSLWAYATLRHYPGSELLDGAARQAVATACRFKPQEVANLLWAYATVGHDPGAALLDAMAAQMAEQVQHFRPQAISNSLWAYSRLGYNPGTTVLNMAVRRVVLSLQQYTPQELANTLWAMGTLEHHPGVQLLDAAALQIASRLDQFSPQDATNSIWAYAKLFHYPCNDLLQSAALYCLRHWHRFKPQEVASMLWALALLKACPSDTWQMLLEKLGGIPVANFDAADQQQLFQVCMLLDTAARPAQMGRYTGPTLATCFPQALLESAEALWKTTVKPTGQLSRMHGEVSSALWALGLLHSSEAVTSDGLFCVDIMVQGNKALQQVVLEVNGPSAFAVNMHRPLGRTIGRRCMLENRGHPVRTIPFYEWQALDSAVQQQKYLAQILGLLGPLARP